MLMTGLAIFALASGLCGGAPTIAILNIARALQGIGAALQLSAALAILSHAFQGKARARAFSFWGSVIGIAIMLGPPVGGLITEFIGWRWVFYLNVPIGIVMLVITHYAVKESRDPHATRLDVAGVLTFSGFLAAVTYALISGNDTAAAAGWLRADIVAAVLCFAAFLFVELKQHRPMVDLAFFRQPTYVGANIAGLAYAVTFLTMLTYLPMFFQTILGESPLRSGFMMLPIAVPLFLVPRLVVRYVTRQAARHSRQSARHSPQGGEHGLSGRVLLTTGLALVTAGLGLTSFALPAQQYGVIVLSMLVASVGAGILNAEVTKVGMSVIPPARAGMASGVASTVRISGIVMGFAALGVVLVTCVAHGVSQALSGQTALLQDMVTREIARGNFSAGALLMPDATRIGGLTLLEIEREIFIDGYQAVMQAAALVALAATALTWVLVKDTDMLPATDPRRARAASGGEADADHRDIVSMPLD
jgi:MFS family permease